MDFISKKIENLQYHLKNFEKKKLIDIDYHIVEHCNLNCEGCLHFSPIAKEECITVEDFTKDMRILKKMEPVISSIKLLGGEPLIHPDLLQVISLCRGIFKNTRILLVTNGILLKTMSEEFWKTCQNNQIAISISLYPINIDFDYIKRKTDNYGIELSVFAMRDDFWKWKIQKKDSNFFANKWYNFFYCKLSNECHTYRQGKMYTCAIAAHIHHFDKFFNPKETFDNKNNAISVEDNSTEKIMSFLSRPIPMCRYCKIKRNIEYRSWRISQKKETEWM